MEWLEEIYEEKNESVAIVKIRDKLDFLVFSDDRAALNTILVAVDTEKCFPSTLFAALKMLRTIKHRLDSYEPFLNRVETRAVAEGLEEEFSQFLDKNEEE